MTILHSGPIDASRPPRDVRIDPRRVVSKTLLTFAGVVGWVLLYVLLLSRFEFNHAQHALYGTLRTELALGTTPTGAPIPDGHPVALLDVPAIGIADIVVVEGTSATELQKGPGHLRGTVLPGQAGVSVLLGRSTSFGSVFGDAPRLVAGDRIAVTTSQGKFTYTVDSVRRRGDPVPSALAADAGRLTLMTTTGTRQASIPRPADTVYIDATLSAGAVTPGAVSAVAPGEAAMDAHVDTGSLALLALSLQLLLIAVAGFMWGLLRWSRIGTWIAGAPVVFAALWVVSSLAMRLAPNLW